VRIALGSTTLDDVAGGNVQTVGQQGGAATMHALEQPVEPLPAAVDRVEGIT